MKLERFVKNKKQKRIIIASIIGLLLIVGGITLFRSYAFYEEKKEFNVINGTVPYFTYKDVEIAVVVNGETKTSLPEKGLYETSVDCTSGTGTWDYLKWDLVLKGFDTGAKCTITFTNTSLTEEELIKKSISPVCKRATKLHEATCNSDSAYGCRAAGYSEGATITYGQIEGASGKLTSGDAFDCDVNGDGVYDSETERFYYVSDYYDGGANSFNNNYATLIYYNNVSGGIANNEIATFYDNNSNENWHGPVTAMKELPTTSQWSNVHLANISRTIRNEIEGLTTDSSSKTIENPYSYNGYAARLLTVKEITQSCNLIVGYTSTGELDDCTYIMENSKYNDISLTYGFWLENPTSDSLDNAKSVYADGRAVSNWQYNGILGVRPVIDVAKSDMLY